MMIFKTQKETMATMRNLFRDLWIMIQTYSIF